MANDARVPHARFRAWGVLILLAANCPARMGSNLPAAWQAKLKFPDDILT